VFFGNRRLYATDFSEGIRNPQLRWSQSTAWESYPVKDVYKFVYETSSED
jgi:hypothetical protein